MYGTPQVIARGVCQYDCQGPVDGTTSQGSQGVAESTRITSRRWSYHSSVNAQDGLWITAGL